MGDWNIGQAASKLFNLASGAQNLLGTLVSNAELENKYGEDYKTFRDKVMRSEDPKAQALRDQLGAIFAPPKGGDASSQDPLAAANATMEALKTAAAKDPDLFKQLNGIILDKNGQVRPSAVEAITAVAGNPVLKEKMQATMSAAPEAGDSNMIASLAQMVSKNPQTLDLIAKNPDVVAGLLSTPDPAQTMSDLGTLMEKLSASKLLDALGKDSPDGGDVQQALGKNLVALLKKDPDALKKLNGILALPGADKFLNLVATNDNLRNGFMKTLLSAGTDPDGSQNILDQIYDASKKHPTILQDTVDMAEKHPKLFDMASGLIGNNPGMAMQSIEMIGGMQNFLSAIPAGLRELLGKLMETLAPMIDSFSPGMGSELASWIKPDAATTVVAASNNQGDMTKTAGLNADQTNDPNGNQQVADAGNVADSGLQKRIGVPQRGLG
jgi:hypothetical protein